MNLPFAGELVIGPWGFSAHVESRPKFVSGYSRGDLLYRVVISFGHLTEEPGSGGEIATDWVESVGEASELAKMISGILLTWKEYNEVADEDVILREQADFSLLVDQAVEVFETVSGTIPTSEASEG